MTMETPILASYPVLEEQARPEELAVAASARVGEEVSLARAFREGTDPLLLRASAFRKTSPDQLPLRLLSLHLLATAVEAAWVGRHPLELQEQTSEPETPGGEGAGQAAATRAEPSTGEMLSKAAMAARARRTVSSQEAIHQHLGHLRLSSNRAFSVPRTVRMEAQHRVRVRGASPCLDWAMAGLRRAQLGFLDSEDKGVRVLVLLLSRAITATVVSRTISSSNSKGEEGTATADEVSIPRHATLLWFFQCNYITCMRKGRLTRGAGPTTPCARVLVQSGFAGATEELEEGKDTLQKTRGGKGPSARNGLGLQRIEPLVGQKQTHLLELLAVIDTGGDVCSESRQLMLLYR